MNNDLSMLPSQRLREQSNRIAELEAELREARMQSLSDIGQAQEAYEAQLIAETERDAAVEALKRLDYWFDTDEDILAAMTPDVRADHERQHTIVRAAIAQIESDTHPDDLAVDRFASAMKNKLAKKRADGRAGWDDRLNCNAGFLSALLHEHVKKGDPLDVGNLAMMLHQRGDKIESETPAKTRREVWDDAIEAAAEKVEIEKYICGLDQNGCPYVSEETHLFTTQILRDLTSTIRNLEYPGDSK